MDHFSLQVVSKRITLVAFIAVLGVSNVSTNSKVWAQSIDEQKERLEKLENEKEIANLKKQIAETKEATAQAEKARIEAEKAAAAASLPKIDSSKAPSGSISVDSSVKFENKILAYQAMEIVAGKIQAEIIDRLGSNISLIVLDKSEIASAALAKLDYKAFNDEVVAIQDDYQALGIVSLESVGIAATADFLFNLLPFFRVDKDIKGQDITIENQAFIAQLTSKLQESSQSKVSVYYPSEYPLITKDAIDDILKAVSTLEQLKRQAEDQLFTLKTDSKKLESASERIEKLQQANKRAEQLINNLKKVETNKKSFFEAVASSLALERIAASGTTYYLSVNITAGGTNRTSKSFLSNRLRHSGGAIVRYAVYDSNASIVASNVHHAYTGFTKISGSK